MSVMAKYVLEMTVKKSLMVNRDCLSICSSCYETECEQSREKATVGFLSTKSSPLKNNYSSSRTKPHNIPTNKQKSDKQKLNK